MEKVLRGVGNAFLSVANAIGEARSAFHAYLFDLAFEADHSNQRGDPSVFSAPSRTSFTPSRIIIFPTPTNFSRSKHSLPK